MSLRDDNSIFGGSLLLVDASLAASSAFSLNVGIILGMFLWAEKYYLFLYNLTVIYLKKKNLSWFLLILRQA